ncbi:hypothetical protein EIP91_008745 [Steccherinum ochraceum]|uniref:EF-hand domain-containing protein n=1 Tax=Steccherinum ochraceum TaxID=92696 RepID=A0A4R0RPM0_9APHY|nr:hypothetical protein EIP91_008745 [Steccherinum ochraceum]
MDQQWRGYAPPSDTPDPRLTASRTSPASSASSLPTSPPNWSSQQQSQQQYQTQQNDAQYWPQIQSQMPPTQASEAYNGPVQLSQAQNPLHRSPAVHYGHPSNANLDVLAHTTVELAESNHSPIPTPAPSPMRIPASLPQTSSDSDYRYDVTRSPEERVGTDHGYAPSYFPQTSPYVALASNNNSPQLLAVAPRSSNPSYQLANRDTDHPTTIAMSRTASDAPTSVAAEMHERTEQRKRQSLMFDAPAQENEIYLKISQQPRVLQVTNTSVEGSDDGSGDSSTESPDSEKPQGFLQTVISGISAVAAMVQDDTVQAVVSTAASTVSSVVPLNDLQSELVNQFPIISDLLTDVAKIHPAISVIVVAFKVAVQFYVARRENDQKVTVVHAAMRDMMRVLFELRDIDPSSDRGQGIATQLQMMCKTAAGHIERCAHSCETYCKQGSFAKYAKALKWKSVFQSLVDDFDKQQEMFSRAIIISIYKTVGSIERKLDAGYHEALQKVADAEQQRGQPTEATAKATVFSLENTATNEIVEPEAALAANLDTFKRKFELRAETISSELQVLQKRFQEAQDAIVDKVDETGRKMMKAIAAGPHELVTDKVLQGIWEEMGWKRNVKAERFVTTLRDCFQDRFRSEYNVEDAWALKYINMAWLGPITDALDEDSSGYITIGELNEFTDSCPRNLDWNVPQWIAYWAVGWQLAAEDYRSRIYKMVKDMSAMVPFILPENRPSVGRYLWLLHLVCAEMLFAFHISETAEQESLVKFKDYIDSEQARIERNLCKVEYHIDALDTVQAITGPGRLEGYIFPLLFCLIKEHLRILADEGRGRVLPDDTLMNARNSLRVIHTSVRNRVQDIAVSFRQRGLDPKLKFQTFACRLYHHMFDNAELWSMSRMMDPHMADRFPALLRPPSVLRTVDSQRQPARQGNPTNSPFFSAKHYNVSCRLVSCGARDIEGLRFILEQLDQCQLLEFHKSDITIKVHHRPTHDTLRLSIGVSRTDLPVVYQAGLQALRQARQRLSETTMVVSRPEDHGSAPVGSWTVYALCKRINKWQAIPTCLRSPKATSSATIANVAGHSHALTVDSHSQDTPVYTTATIMMMTSAVTDAMVGQELP